MMHSKMIAVFFVMTMLVAPLCVISEDSDADSMEIIDGLSIDTGSVDGSGISSVFEKFVTVMNALQGGVCDLQFSESEDNVQKVKDALKEISDEAEVELSDDEINTITGYLGLLPTVLLSSYEFTPEDDLEITKGHMKAANDIPDYLIHMFTSDSDSVELNEVGEMGCLMDFGTKMTVSAGSDIDNTGLFFSSAIKSISSALGNYSAIAKNFVVTDNSGLLEGVDVNIAEGSRYSAESTVHAAVYTSFKLDTNFDTASSGEKIYVKFNIGLHVKGEVETDMKLLSGSGPETMKSSLKFDSLDLEVGLGLSDILSLNPGLIFGINGIGIDATYSTDIDGEQQSMSMKNSGIMALMNGVQISMNNGDMSVMNVNVSGVNHGEKVRSPEMNAIIGAAMNDSTADVPFDNTKQMIVGGSLAVVGLILIIAVRFGKKY